METNEYQVYPSPKLLDTPPYFRVHARTSAYQ